MVTKLRGTPAKEPPFRAVVCGTCKWTVAAASYDALLGAGWSGCAGKMKETDKRWVFAFICKTCAKKYPARLCKMPNGKRYFKTLPSAPENPFPCVGVEGHETSRPENEDAPVVGVLQ